MHDQHRGHQKERKRTSSWDTAPDICLTCFPVFAGNWLVASRCRAERAACMAFISSSAAFQQGDACEYAWKGEKSISQTKNF
jgi:hypothetical protein